MREENMLLLGFIFFALAEFELGVAQRSSSSCSRDRMRQCSEMLLRNTQRRIVDLSRSEMTSQCMNVRDDFNCLLRETRCLSSESERNRNGDTLRNALKYIRDGCDTNGASWRDSSCYVGDSMKTCESSYPLGGSQYASYNPETCRKFNLFQDCVMEAVRTRCQRDDERLLGQYMVDTAQDLAWNCGEASSSSDWDRSRDDRYDRDRYDRNGDSDRDRDRDRDRGRGDSWRDRDRGYSSRDRDPSRDRDSSRDRDPSRDRDWDRTSDRYDRNGGYDRNHDRDGSSGGTCCRNERCSTSRMQQCRDSLTRAVDTRSSGYQDSQKCRQIRDDFNCLLWQTSNCAARNEKDRDNDLFRRGIDFISKNCDTYGRWSENSCYKSAEMTRCERSISSARGGATYDSCRSYLSFRDCMQDELQRRCTREDDLYQGSYLVDKAQELSWQCGDDQQSNGRNQYYTDNRRDPYDSGYNSNDRYNGPEHLEDDDAMCLSRIQAYNDQCKAKLDEKRRDIYITNEYEARQRINCCSAREYRSCLFDATRRVCQSERKRVVDALMGRYTFELSSDNCRRIYDNDCSSATHNQLSTLLLLLCAVILPIFFLSHLK